MLARPWRKGFDVRAHWVSEKLDGVRGYWDGEALWTRQGGRVRPPSWFTEAWPASPLDGELWAGRGRFEFAQSTIARDAAGDAAWRQMRFMVFDLPSEAGSFDQRLARLAALCPAMWPRPGRGGHAGALPPAPPYLLRIEQFRVDTAHQLRAELDRAVALGGEGLVLHRADTLYRAGRSDDLLKLKPHEDAEARVLAVLPGRGRLAGRMGALLVETAEGVRFKLGAGFSDAERLHPPPVGSQVTFRYRGTSATGVPRFASYLRVRLL